MTTTNKMIYKHHKTYNPFRQTSINLNEDQLAFLRFLKEKGYVTSVSEAIRQLIMFAFPFYFHTIFVVREAPKGKVKPFIFKKPKKPTQKQLRKLYPNTPDYKYINEKK